MKKINILIFLFVSVLIAQLSTVQAGTTNRLRGAVDIVAVADATNGRVADVVDNYDAIKVITVGGENTAYADADEVVISGACRISAISFMADTAGEDVIFYDAGSATGAVKWRIMQGLANDSKPEVFPAGLKFDTDVYVDVDAGCEVYIAYSLETD